MFCACFGSTGVFGEILKDVLIRNLIIGIQLLFDLAFGYIYTSLDLYDPFTHCLGKFRQLLGTENQERYNEDNDEFLKTDIKHLREKIDAGGEYIVTQMFFDNSVYFAFVEKCREIGISVPIIPGIKPIALMNQLTVLPKIFKIDLPSDLVKALKKCTSDDQARQVGTEWSVFQAKELIRARVPSLHIYTYGISDNVKEIVKAVF